jgi:hypothetical protein
LIDTLLDGMIEPGNHKIQWNASNYSTGIYFVTLASGIQVQTQKLILLK